MKNYLSLIILTILSMNLFAQDITVSFKTSNAVAVIDSVQAINLATNDTVNLMGNETLTLVNSTSGAVTIQNLKGGIFPNPCNGSATLKFSTSSGDDATIQVVNSSGQLVMEKKQAISAGAHSFSVGFPDPGIYIVLVKTSNKVLSFKEVSNIIGIQEPSLSYLGSSQRTLELATLKSATTGKTLNYSTGNNVMYTLYSGKNIRVMVDQPTTSKNYNVAFYECADKDGRNYKTVTIGNQVWMAENLAYLPSVNTSSEYSNIASLYYVYDYDGNNVASAKATNNYKTYGVLYNWPAAVNGGSGSTANQNIVQGVCPAGWHLPNDAEWTTLENYLTNNGYGFEGSGDDIAKSLATTSGWGSSFTVGTPGGDLGRNNSSGFSALPGGAYYGDLGFGSAGYDGSWWSSMADHEYYAWYRLLSYYQAGFYKGSFGRHYGFSVRCVKD